MTAYFLSNIFAKNYKNRLMFVDVIASQSSVVFWDSASRYSPLNASHTYYFNDEEKGRSIHDFLPASLVD